MAMVVVNNEVPIGVGLSEFDACWWLNNNQNHSFLAYPPTFQSWHLTTLSVCGLEATLGRWSAAELRI